ncbi:MAG: twin-arginine translocation signal domain-containing protein [Pyrinomonadaceae bacterium]
MSISRRKFLQVGAVAAVAAGTPLSITALADVAKTSKAGALKASTKAASAIPVSHMSKAQFASHLNTTFFIRSVGAHELPVRLIELEDRVPEPLQDAAALRGKECFSLAFRGPAKNIEQDTYRVRHTTLGEFDLFIGTVKNKKHGRIYEAIINHLDM